MATDSPTFEHLVLLIQQTHQALLERTTKAVNISLTARNWLIGFHIAEFELQGADRATYGENLLNELARALQARNVSNSGRRQLYGYLSFYRAYPQIVRTLPAISGLPGRPALDEKVRTLSAQSGDSQAVDPELLISRLSFSHLEQLVELPDPLMRNFYEIEAMRGNWSVRELKRQIATQYFERCGLSTDKDALSRLAHVQAERQAPAQVIRDPYVFEFLGLKSREVMSEGHLEDALIDKLQEFLLELGHGFCFEARQKRLLIGGEHFFVDLVFYHRVLKCHVLVELKNDRFQHEHLGQLNSYVAWYKQHQMTPGDQPPVGILLCTHKNHELVEFAPRGHVEQAVCLAVPSAVAQQKGDCGVSAEGSGRVATVSLGLRNDVMSTEQPNSRWRSVRIGDVAVRPSVPGLTYWTYARKPIPRTREFWVRTGSLRIFPSFRSDHAAS